MRNEEMLRRPATDFTAHRPPALLVDRVLAVPDGGDDVGRVALSEHDGLDGLQLCEATAQAMAVLRGCSLRLDAADADDAWKDPQPFRGYLVGARDFSVVRAALPGEAVSVTARCTCELGGFRLYEVRVFGAGDELLAAGELKVYDPREEEP